MTVLFDHAYTLPLDTPAHSVSMASFRRMRGCGARIAQGVRLVRSRAALANAGIDLGSQTRPLAAPSTPRSPGNGERVAEFGGGHLSRHRTHALGSTADRDEIASEECVQQVVGYQLLFDLAVNVAHRLGESRVPAGLNWRPTQRCRMRVNGDSA